MDNHPPPDQQIAGLVRELRLGSHRAKGELVHLLFPELRRIAARKLAHERPNHTLQPTALVNELYMELLRTRSLRDRDYPDSAEKQAFLQLAGHMMQRLLIHHARPLSRRAPRVELDEDLLGGDPSEQALRHVDDALDSLQTLDPRLRAVVEMKVFEGLSNDEMAARLNCSPRTVVTLWSFARNWLQKEWAGRPLDP